MIAVVCIVIDQKGWQNQATILNDLSENDSEEDPDLQIKHEKEKYKKFSRKYILTFPPSSWI